MKPTKKLLVIGGYAGIAGTLLYISVIFLNLPSGISLFLVFLWTFLSIVFAYVLLIYLEELHPSIIARLGFILAVCGFATVFIMVAIQLAVNTGMNYYKSQLTMPEIENYWKNTTSSLRLIDMGIDVAWDVFIGTSLVFIGFAMYNRKGFRQGWAIITIILGIAAIILNLITFPFPPNTRGLFDIGPFVGSFIIALSGRLVFIGYKYHSENIIEKTSEEKIL